MLNFFKKDWWKYLSIVLILYSLIGGLLLPVPALDIVNETIRNQYYHVPMWFGMTLLMIVSLVMSLRYLARQNIVHDYIAAATVNICILYGILGLVTGMVWANYTWGDWWNGDIKQNMAAIALLIYMALAVLRSSIEDEEKRAKIASVYNVFAFFAVIALIFVIPRMYDSLHPGSGGNPGFAPYDLDSWMRIVFYPAVIGFTLFGLWMASLEVRAKLVENKMLNLD